MTNTEKAYLLVKSGLKENMVSALNAGYIREELNIYPYCNGYDENDNCDYKSHIVNFNGSFFVVEEKCYDRNDPFYEYSIRPSFGSQERDQIANDILFLENYLNDPENSQSDPEVIDFMKKEIEELKNKLKC